MARHTRLAIWTVSALVGTLPAASGDAGGSPAESRVPLAVERLGEAPPEVEQADPVTALGPPRPAPPEIGRPGAGPPVAEPPGEQRPPTPACPECPIPRVSADLTADCPDWQWIGIVEPAAVPQRAKGEPRPELVRDCPLPPGGGWSARHLFCPTPSPHPAAGASRDPQPPAFPLPPDCDPAGLPAALRPFCLYRHEDRGADLAALGVPGLTAVERDCAAVGELAAEAGELVRFTLPQRQAHFLAQVGAVGAPGTAEEARPADATARVRLAVVDTSPTSADARGVEPSSLHGRTLVALADRLLGGAGNRSIALTERLALAYLRFDRSSRRLALRDEVRGGFFGTFGDLARAIRDEVVAWQAGGERHLLLNLSVGWQRAVGGLETDVAAMPPPVQAVYRALEDARCRGALALAAAGNRTWGPELEPNLGPLLPAAWEARPTPSRAACAAAVAPDVPGLFDDGPGPADDYRPLLAAAGGIEAEGRPLGNSRAAFGGEPRLVAFADHAVVERVDRPGRPTAVLTGSSVAAVVASAVAAAAWSREPDLDAFQLVDRLYSASAGADLGRAAGFCRGADEGSCPFTVRRLSLSSVMAARRDPADPVVAETPPPPLRLDSSRSPAFENATTLQAGGLRRLPANASSACPPPEIAAALRRAGEEARETFRAAADDARARLYPCPRWQLPDVSARFATGPQPESSPCTGCGFEQNSPGTAYLEIDADFGARISSPVLYVGPDAYALPENLQALRRLRIEDLPAAADDRVFLSVVVDGNRSATVPLLRVRRP